MSEVTERADGGTEKGLLYDGGERDANGGTW